MWNSRNRIWRAQKPPSLTAEQIDEYFDLIEEGTPNRVALRRVGATQAQIDSTFDALESLFERSFHVMGLLADERNAE